MASLAIRIALRSDFLQGIKHIGIQDVFPVSSVLSFNVGVLHRLTWLDVLDNDPFHLTPLDKHPASKFRPVIDPDLLRATAVTHNQLQHFYHLLTGDLIVTPGCQAFPGIVIHDIEDPQSPSSAQCIAHEIHAIAFIRLLLLLQRFFYPGRQPSFMLTAEL